MSNRHLQTQLLQSGYPKLSLNKPAPHTSFPLSAHGNSILPTAQAKTLGVILDSALSNPTSIHWQSMEHLLSKYLQNPPSFLLFLCYLPGPNSILCPNWSPTSNTSPISDWFYVQNTSPIFAFSLFLRLPPWPQRHHLLLGLGWWPPDGHHWSTRAPSSLVSTPQGSPFTRDYLSVTLLSPHWFPCYSRNIPGVHVPFVFAVPSACSVLPLDVPKAPPSLPLGFNSVTFFI